MRITRFPLRSVVLVGAIVVATSTACGVRSTPPTPIDLSAVRRDLTNFRTAQEVYYSNNNSYSSSVSALKFAPTGGVAIKFLEASANAYSVAGTLAGKSGVSCVMMIGNVSAMPKTERGAAARAEGEVLCDGDPPA